MNITSKVSVNGLRTVAASLAICLAVVGHAQTNTTANPSAPPAQSPAKGDPTPPPEHRRPGDFKPLRYRMTTEQLMEKYSAKQMRRAEAEFQEMALANEKGPWKPTFESLDNHGAPEWFLDAKLGIMLNWGLHSVPAWDLKRPLNQPYGAMYPDAYGNNMYWFPGFTSDINQSELHRLYHVKNWGADFQWDDFIPLFKAEKYDPEGLMAIWKQAGAKYIVTMSKHHDGFVWWDSAWSNRNAVEMGPKKDLFTPMLAAAKKENFKVMMYFTFNEYATSVIGEDGKPYVRYWHWPAGQIKLLPLDEGTRRRISGSIPVKKCFRHYTTPLIKEAIDRFDPDGLWLDGEWTNPAADLDSRELAAYFYNKAEGRKEVAVNDRFERGSRSRHGDYFCSEYNTTQSYVHPWEECQGISQSFAYNWQDDDARLGPPTELIHRFIKIVSNNGNLVIIGGPKASGEYPENVVVRLKALGAWLKVNGEAIYATRVLPPYQEGTVSYTRSKNGKFGYAICKEWPGRQLVLKGVTSLPQSRITMLGVAKPFVWKQDAEKLAIDIPDELQDPKARPCEHAWAVKIPMAPR
jgi:alpha-L-fucosidase